MDKFYVTTPIYYVNDKPHIGHAYTTILADVLTRYHRLTGVKSFFLTGTDEHGQKVQEAAARGNINPKSHADTMVVRFSDLWRKLGISNDDFIRTTEPRHFTVVQKILQDLFDRGEIYRSDYDGWYCVACERFYTEKDVVDCKCPAEGCGRPVERITESNYFFRMSKYQDWLIQYIQDNPKFIQPDFRRNETLGFLRKKLNDLCISRPKKRLSWGIELPFDKDYVTYVWFDALLNYITAIGYLENDRKFTEWWPASVQLIGKDILTTHTVYWPTMLKAMNLPMPETVFAHGWWLSGGDKMSKTRGNVVNPMDIAEKHGVDAFRYFLMAEMSLGQDASFTEDAFTRRYNADLANDLGNLLSRVMKLTGSHCGGAIPKAAVMDADATQLSSVVLDAVEKMLRSADDMKLDSGLAAVCNATREVNRYLEKKQPWTLAKSGPREEFETVMYCAAEALRIISGILSPVMPGKMMQLRAAIGLGGSAVDLADLKKWGVLEPGTRIAAQEILFPRIVAEVAPAAGSLAAPVVAPAAPAVADDGRISYEDFRKAELRTAKVVAAEKIQGADKLLKLEIEIGSERRQIVAGIAQHYTPEQVIGRTIVVVANLKPAKVRGVESNGMLLAAVGEGKLRLIGIDGETPSGLPVQ